MPLITRVDAGDPRVILAGIHVGCFQLFGGERVRAIRDLKGKTVAIFFGLGSPEHVFLASMAAYVGVDPRQNIRWVTHPFEESTRLLAEGTVDAVLAFPPQAQELRARQVGQVVVNSLADRPWSQYFCCMAYAHREFVRTHPVATKRALRAILKAAAVCSREPVLNHSSSSVTPVPAPLVPTACLHSVPRLRAARRGGSNRSMCT